MNSPATSHTPASVSPQPAPSGSLGLYAVTIFLSAFLLFQVQPLIAKLILPWFGGSAAVWVTCMLFFQIALLLGYGYAHFLVRSVPLSRQATVHMILLVLSLAVLPILPNPRWKPAGGDDPLLGIMGLLAVTVGLPYMLLSSTSPLLQSWYSRSREGGLPYRFFALSNLGSMLALISYPILVEPYISNRTQAWVWSGAFVAFAVCCVAVALSSRQGHVAGAAADLEEDSPAPSFSQRLLWMLLAAGASAMLLAVTNHMTQNVAAIPFLWIVPLAIYLLTFILCFESHRWYKRVVFVPIFAAGLGLLAWFITTQETPDTPLLAILIPKLAKYFKEPAVMDAIIFLSLVLFVICMVCHGELSRLKPHTSHLTGFYLTISVGGAIGGLFVAFFAPRVFHALYEFPILVVVAAWLILWVFWMERPPFKKKEEDEPEAVSEPAVKRWNPDIWWTLWGCAAALSLVMAGYLVQGQRKTTEGARLLVRNFYGALKIADTIDDGIPVRQLTHGTIDHGEQILDVLRRRWPTTYYGPNSGVGLTIKKLQELGPVRYGVIGLGTGTLSTYARKGDYCRIYDINPLVMDIARTQFTFVPESPGQIDLVLGDARLSLERDQPQNFDVIAVDAFSSDSIPIHLLTREAFLVYWRQLKPDGVLAVHVSNRYLNLEPVVHLAALSMGKKSAFISSEEDSAADVFTSDWVLVTSRPGFLESEPIKSARSEPATRPNIRMWTDDYSNLWQIVH
jgi:SAM-dependent methyltransferase